MAEKKSLELFLFTDEPARDLDHDHLAIEPFSSMVAAAALTNRGPFNIGVFSGWGQGKTTVLRQAQALVAEQEKPNVITAWVNAWQYEHEAHPIVPLLAIIINEITKAIDARKYPSEEENAALAKTFGDLKRALRSIAYGFSAKAGATIPGFANLEIGFVAKDMIDRDEKLSSDRDPLLDQSLYYHAYDRLEKFRDQLAASTPATQPKIIVFIDDLDRCLPSKALHLLESLKLVLAQPGFIFVLAVDRHVIDSFLTKRYHEDFGIHAEKGHGKQYMDKIIQLPLDLPHHQNRFEDYIWKTVCDPRYDGKIPQAFGDLFGDGKTGLAFMSALAAGCDRTPRTLIRTLNYLLTDLFLRENEFFNQEDDPFTNSAEFLQFAAVSRITRLTLGDERLYRRLVASEWGCNELCDYIEGLKNVWESTHDDPQYGCNYPGGEERFENERAKIDPFKSIINQSESLNELFLTELGRMWLREHAKRKAIESYLATREDSSNMSDENSEQIINSAIRRELNLHAGQDITDEHRGQITRLDLTSTQVSDLTIIEYLENLNFLSLSGTLVGNIKPLQKLKNLQMLYLSGTQVVDIEPLRELTNMRYLSLNDTPVANIAPLADLVMLEKLDLRNTQVKEVSLLMRLAKLELIRLKGSPAALDEAAVTRLDRAMPKTEVRFK